MKKSGKFSHKAPKKNSRLIIVLCCIAVALVLLIIGMIAAITLRQPDPTDPTTVPTTQAPTTEEPTTMPTETTVPPETEPVMMAHMEELYTQNPDFVGWLKLEGTPLDNHVMHTPENEEKYLRTDFNGKPSTGGVPFISKDCSLDPESDNIIIYGHNMVSNGTMFHVLLNYANQEFWEEHPVIEFSTLYETREYEVIAAFYDRVYFKYEDVFKFYQFVDAETEEDFQEAIDYYMEHSEIDTGLTAEYGDRLLTLVTCSYHHKYGRFVVIARQSMPKEVPAETVGE